MPLVHDQAFDLVELRQMGWVGHVAAVYFAGADDVDRRLLRLHDARLDRRGLRAQKNARFALHVRMLVMRTVYHVERVRQTAARMVFRRVQGVEVVVLRFDLGAVSDGIAQTEKISAISSAMRLMRWRVPSCCTRPGSVTSTALALMDASSSAAASVALRASSAAFHFLMGPGSRSCPP